MSWAFRGRDLKRLEWELDNDDHRALLQQTTLSDPFLARFNSWSEVVAFMRVGTLRDPLKDKVLCAIFEAYTRDRDPRWRTALLAIFWPTLESIHQQKRHWDKFEPDLLWQNLQWAFLQTIDRIDVQKRPDGLASKICNDTINRLYRAYALDWRRLERECELPEDESGDLMLGEECLELAAVDVADEKDAEIKELRRYLEAGVIGEAEYYQAVGTRVYGESLSEYARHGGFKYEAVKKRNQRLTAKIQRHEKRNRISRAFSCPHSDG